MNNITSQKYFIPAFAGIVLLIVVGILLLSGGSVPSDSVAVVKDEKITKQRFDSVLKIFVTQSQPDAKGSPVLPDPPEFTKCIANKRKSAPKKTTNADLKKQCQTEWDTAKEQIMTTLIQQKWYALEAEDRNISISDNEVKQRFIPLKQQTFPKEDQYKKFLQNSGQTEADLLNLVRNNMYQEKVREQVTKSGKITSADIKEYFDDNRDKFVQPASRDLRVVFTEKKSDAEAAAAALKAGDSWTAVTKEYSDDSATKENAGKFPGVTKGQFEPALDKAVFKSSKGTIVGPIKTQFGYYVFEVEKSNEEKQQTLKEAEPTIRQAIQSEQQQARFDAFQKEFTEKWRKKTKCADLYKIELCKNGPEPKEPTAPAGGAQQQAPPQQAPPQQAP